MSSSSRTIDQLTISPFNVRMNRADATATTALEASILADGLLNALDVHLMRGTSGKTSKWGVFAGGRRYRSIQNLIARGALPADYQVRVDVHEGLSDGQLLEKSLAENMLRRDLRDYELFAGVRKAHAKGEKVEAIAEALGQDPHKVMRWLKLGQLAKPIFAAFTDDEITLEHAQAYAAVDDQELQQLAYEYHRDLPLWEKTPEKIRAWLKVGDRELDRLLRYVGEKAYRDAGGRFTLDLFAEQVEQRGRVEDEAKLRSLAEDMLTDKRADLRRRVGRNVRFIPKPPHSDTYDATDVLLHIDAKPGEGDAIILPDGDVVGCLTISEAGEPEVSWWWASRTAKYGTEKPERVTSLRPPRPTVGIVGTASPAAREANAVIKEDEGIGQETIEILRTMRRQILRARLVDDANDNRSAIGRDFFVWSQLRLLIDVEARASVIGVTPLDSLDAGPDGGRDLVGRMPATGRWSLALTRLQARPFMKLEDLPAAFRAYLTEGDEWKDLAGAVMAGMTLQRSLNAEAYDSPVHCALAQMLELDNDLTIRMYWLPTEQLLDRIPPKQRLSIAEPFVERAAFAGWSQLKSAELTRSVLSVVTGTAAWLRDKMRDQATSWVHPLLRFNSSIPDEERPAPAAQLQEAAE